MNIIKDALGFLGLSYKKDIDEALKSEELLRQEIHSLSSFLDIVKAASDAGPIRIIGNYENVVIGDFEGSVFVDGYRANVKLAGKIKEALFSPRAKYCHVDYVEANFVGTQLTKPAGSFFSAEQSSTEPSAPVECAICRDLGGQCMECEEVEFREWADRHFASADYRKTDAGVFIQDWMRHAYAAWCARASLERKP